LRLAFATWQLLPPFSRDETGEPHAKGTGGTFRVGWGVFEEKKKATPKVETDGKAKKETEPKEKKQTDGGDKATEPKEKEKDKKSTEPNDKKVEPKDKDIVKENKEEPTPAASTAVKDIGAFEAGPQPATALL